VHYGGGFDKIKGWFEIMFGLKWFLFKNILK
jgi:hypothetical protein